MTRTATYLALAAALVALATLTVACDPSSGGGRKGQAELDRHQAAADDLAARLSSALAPLGRVGASSPGFRECEGASESTSGAFEYDVALGVTVAADTARPYLDAVRAATGGLGLDVEPDTRAAPGGASTLTARDGDIKVTFREDPPGRDGGDVVKVTVYSPCVKTDPDDTRYWQQRRASGSAAGGRASGTVELAKP